MLDLGCFLNRRRFSAVAISSYCEETASQKTLAVTPLFKYSPTNTYKGHCPFITSEFTMRSIRTMLKVCPVGALKNSEVISGQTL